jgi:hypothetical protein
MHELIRQSKFRVEVASPHIKRMQILKAAQSCDEHIRLLVLVSFSILVMCSDHQVVSCVGFQPFQFKFTLRIFSCCSELIFMRIFNQELSMGINSRLDGVSDSGSRKIKSIVGDGGVIGIRGIPENRNAGFSDVVGININHSIRNVFKSFKRFFLHFLMELIHLLCLGLSLSFNPLKSLLI